VASASKHFAKFKLPAEKYVFLRNEALPKGATGKIDKKGMRKHYQKELGLKTE